ncbi:MAG TPA: response regulator [Bryobacteraceae bacterium]|nr:response regulator [Bryobacteraceae bacterium]HUO29651.1 response regulator [Bryobacteraceae bacterium]
MAAAKARTLLVVDDDPAIHDLIRAMLAGEPWEIDSAANGHEALARLNTRCYDAVLTDILMPGMDGLTLLGRLRERYPGLPVVMMTVRNTSDHILGSLRQEATAYVAKPFVRDSLLVTLETALRATVAEDDIRIISDKPNWISLQIKCKLATADRLTQFVRELPADLQAGEREQIAIAFRELLMNAIEHGGHLDPEKRVDLSYIRTARSIVYYIRDPGEGFSMENLAHAAVANTPDAPFRHIELRSELGIRPGGFGLLMTRSFADELIYSAKGNEVIFIKYL